MRPLDGRCRVKKKQEVHGLTSMFLSQIAAVPFSGAVELRADHDVGTAEWG